MHGHPERRVAIAKDNHYLLSGEDDKLTEIAIGRDIARLVTVVVGATAAAAVPDEAGRALVAKAKKS